MSRRVRIVRGAFALLVLAAMGSACQVALRADGEDPICTLPQGSKCPGSDLICTDVVDGMGRCRPCVARPEICNGVDDNCDGQIDEGYDRDGDGFVVCGKFNPDLTPVPNTMDCNDDPDTGGAAIFPGASELCNGIDDNCNNVTDESTCPGGECWPLKPGCAASGDCCTVKDDCRLHGCKSLGCNPDNGKCEKTDCTTTPCDPGFECDPVLKACIKRPALGEPCTSTDKCKEGDCIDAAPFGLPAGRKVCSKACCMAEDCPSGFVCRYSSTAAAVCIRGTDLGLQTGSATAYAGCGTGKDCRSGVCTASKCEDGCCGTVRCGAGGSCSLRTDNKFLCRAAPGSADAEGFCLGGGDCKTGYCESYYGGFLTFCGKRCCTSFDCTSDERCVIQKFGDQLWPVCLLTSATVGAKKGGEACIAGNECRSGTCNDGRCSEYCCHDSDCDPATICKPSASGPLRCLPKGA